MYEIKQSTLSCDKGKWFCMLHNPDISGITKVIYGGNYGIVERKIAKQLKAWELTRDEDIALIEEIKGIRIRECEQNKNNDDLPW